MIEATLLLAIPLGLSWFTARQMHRLHHLVRHREEELEALSGELESLQEESRQFEQQMRQYVYRRSRLWANIEARQDELQELRDPLVEKLAA